MWSPTRGGRWLEVGRPQVHGYAVSAVCCVGDGGERRHRFVSGADEKQLRVFDAPKATLKTLKRLTPYEAGDDDEEGRAERAFLPSLGLSNKAGDGQVEDEVEEDVELTKAGDEGGGVLSERDLGVASLWPETGKLYGHDSEILSLASTAQSLERSSPNIVVVSACKARDAKDAALRLWRVGVGVCLKVLDGGHKSSVTCLSFDPTGTVLVSSGKDRRVCVWSVDADCVDEAENKSKLESATDSAHKRILWGLSFCNTKEPTFVSGSRDMTAKVWRVNADFSLSNLHSVKFESSVTACAFALPHNPLLCAVGLEDGGLKLISFNEDFSSHEEVLSIEGAHVATVKKVAWRPGGDEMVLASCGLDHAVKVNRITSI